MKNIKLKFVAIVVIYLVAIIMLFKFYRTQEGATTITALKDLSPTAVISGFITLYMTYVYQNNTIAMQEQTKITSDCPHVIIRNELELPEFENAILIKLRIADEKNRILTKAIINEIDISWSDSLFGKYSEDKQIYKKPKNKAYMQLEYTPSDSDVFHQNINEKEDYYYIVQKIDCPKQELFKSCFRMKIDFSVCSNDVEVNYLYTILVNPDDTNTLSFNNYTKYINHKYFVIKSTKYIGSN